MRLRRADCSQPGITRRRRGKGFTYADKNDQTIRDASVMARIRTLGIPPAWQDVWICPHHNGHLQAVGTDAAGRRQYLYHEEWERQRSSDKFDQMLDFARALPNLRGVVAERLDEPDLTKDRVLACAVRLLDLGFFRVGGERYADEHGSYGLATLEKRHVQLLSDNVIVFDYRAKSGKRRIQAVVDPDVYETAADLKRRRSGGDAFLAYRNGRWADVQSSEINATVKELAGPAFSAKDFRTWHATVLAAIGLAVSSRATSHAGRKRAISRAVEEVAQYLGNTPAVCRASYIDPRVIDRYLAGQTIAAAVESLALPSRDQISPTHGEIEEALLHLLGNGSR
jgi:DNA topoisomerase I